PPRSAVSTPWRRAHQRVSSATDVRVAPMRSAWGDFSRHDEAPSRGQSEGPSGRIVGLGRLFLVVGLGVMLMGILLRYEDLNGPNDMRANNHIAFLWVPGAILAVIGVALFAWGCWRGSHSN